MLCPMLAYCNMMKLVPGSLQDPLFKVRKGNLGWLPVTYSQYMTKLRKVIIKIGRDPAAYSTHSFRRGGATFAGMVGLPRQYIMAVGDWKSDAVDKYLATPLEARIKAARLLRDELNA